MADDVPPWARPKPSPAVESTVDPVEADGPANRADPLDESIDRPLFPPRSGPAAALFPGSPVRRPPPPMPAATAAGGTRPSRLVAPIASPTPEAPADGGVVVRNPVHAADADDPGRPVIDPDSTGRASAAKAHLDLPRAGRIVGAVTGRPTQTTERREFLGQRVLMVALVFALIMSVAFLLSAGPKALGPLLFPTVIVMVLVVVYQLTLRGIDWGATGRATRTMIKQTRPAPRTTATRSANEIVVSRFRLTPTAGDGFIDCVMYGQPHGPELNHGDFVMVTARRTRDGNYDVSHIQVLRTPTGPVDGQITARPSLRFRVARLGSRLSFVLTGLVAAWVVFVLIAFVS